MKQLAALFAFAALLLAGTGCNKNKGGDDDGTIVVPEKAYDFEVLGDTYVFSTVIFRSNLESDQEILWGFGDGNFSKIQGTQTKHAYVNPGTYQVTMQVNGEDSKMVSKNVTIGQGTNRFSGERTWHFLLKQYKSGWPLDHIPPSQFDHTMTMQITDDETIQIPTIPNMRNPGPFVVKLKETTENSMLFESDDELTKLSYSHKDHRAFISMTQTNPSKDSSWHLDGSTDIYD